MIQSYTTTSHKQTQKIGEELAKEILELSPKSGAIILTLHGNLGAGKTTFLQGFAKGLKIKEKILSPTFVIQKRFKIKNKSFKNFYHFDCYRLKNHEDVLSLDFEKIILNPENIIAVEWPERIKKVLSKDAIKIDFKFINKDKRGIKIIDF
jgi:tRNA threonylcarbamoyladenosine biosynthesis protein TsaE